MYLDMPLSIQNPMNKNQNVSPRSDHVYNGGTTEQAETLGLSPTAFLMSVAKGHGADYCDSPSGYSMDPAWNDYAGNVQGPELRTVRCYFGCYLA